MYMKDMVKYLEDRGFEVRKEYHRDTESYSFTIKKGSVNTKGEFEYRPKEPAHIRNDRQKRFLEDLIWSFDKYVNDLIVAGYYPKESGQFEVGTHVTVIKGPYKGFAGPILEHCSDKHLYKIRVLDNTWWVKEDEVQCDCKCEEKEGDKSMFKQFDKVVIRKGLFEGYKGTISAIVPSTEFPGQRKFRVILTGLTGMAEKIYNDNQFFHAWELMRVDDDGDGDVNDNFWAVYGRQSTSRPWLKPFKFEIPSRLPEIKDVIFNPPATIVLWKDDTKTIVKCQDYEEFDPEKGLSMAISKKALGNQGNYFETFKKWLPDEDSLYPKTLSGMSIGERLNQGLSSLQDYVDKRIASKKQENKE